MKLPSPLHKSHLKQLKCLWRADQFFNRGVEQVYSQDADDGTWRHDLIQLPYEGVATESQALSCCETEEDQEILLNAWGNDPYREIESLIEVSIAVDENGTCYLGPEEGAYFSGRLDRLIPPDSIEGSFRERTAIVSDWKTGWLQEQDQNETIAYSMLGWAWCKANGYEVERVQFVYDFCRFGNREATIYTVQDLPILWGLLKSRITAYEQMPAIPIPGHHCANCQFCGGVCPLGITIETALPVEAVYAPGTPIEAREILNQALVEFNTTGQMTPEMAPFVGFAVAWFDKKASDLKSKLKTWILANNQNIPIGDTEWAVAEEDGDKWDHEAVWNILKRAEIPEDVLMSILHITKQTAGKLKKTNPAIYEELMGWARLKQSPKQVLRQRKLAVTP